MSFYKDLNNNVHHLDDAAHEHLLPIGSLKITDEEAAALRPSPTSSDLIQAQIDGLEATHTKRRDRERSTPEGQAWMDALEQQIASLRAQL